MRCAVEQIVDAVRGMRDILPEELLRQQQVARRLNQRIALHGYQPIDLPMLEHRDLYMRKLGEELVGKIYEFSFNGRDLALRPEWTASVLRAYIANKFSEYPLPLRLSYTGPVFRYERPQRGTWRQFTQVGVEMIGAPSPRGDAEVLALACAGLDAVGISDYRVNLGHIGIIRTLLGSLGLSERTRSVLTWSLERMRSRGVDAVRDALLSEIEGERQAFDTTILEGLDDAQAEDLLLHTLRSIGVNLQFGTRPPEEIVRRLVRTMRTNDQRATIERAIDVLAALSAIRGTPSDALTRLRDLIVRYNLPDPGLVDLQALIDLLPLHGLDVDRITLDFGLGRGLHYYTGMMFEIDNPTGLQLCGGGRYDELVTALGGRQSTPAVGFAYGLERVVLAAPELPQARARSVIVIPQDAGAYADAVQIAHRLREAGVVAQCEMRERTMAQHLKDAQRRGLATLVVQAHDAQAGTAQWRHDGESLTLSLSEIIARCEVSP